ncbi:MAG TPA: hypothetical protein VGL21_01085 [Jatrophihabitantaceae bacterium]|jgi:hypothetical protein
MTDPSTGDGGFTGDADGAPFSGYDPGPAEQSSADVPANPSGMSPEQLHRLEESDKPIEYDPIGQALVSLPVGLAQGAVTAAAEGVGLGAELLKEGVAWGASELGIGAAEHVVEGGSEGAEHENAEPPAEPDPYDAGVTDQGAGYE